MKPQRAIGAACRATVAATALCLLSAQAMAESGVSADKILLGQSAALAGPASALGQGMMVGLNAAFKEANDAGGVNGRQVEMISLDDGYEPERAIANTRSLIEEKQVFALIGGVGTPTSKAAQPITTAAGVPYVGPFTGAGFLRNPELKNVINVRGTYDQETESWIEHLTADLGYKKIAILYQDDSFGRAGLSGVQKAMEKRGLTLIAEGTYKRNTTAVKAALLKIKKSNPEAVVMVGPYKPMAAFIKLAKKVKLNARFVNISFVGSQALANELKEKGAGVVVTQTVPLPQDGSLKLVSDYHNALKAYDSSAKPGFVSLEGYMVGRVFLTALERAGKDVTRESFLAAVYNGGPIDLGGVTLTYGDGDNQGMDKVYLTVIQPDGQFSQVDKLN